MATKNPPIRKFNRIDRAVLAACIVFVACIIVTGIAHAFPFGNHDDHPNLEAAAQNQQLAHDLIDATDHANDLLWPLIANTAHCARQAPRIGFRFFELARGHDDQELAIAHQLGFEPGVSVDHVIPNSPAAKAGLQAGDQVTQINGKDLPGGKRAAREANALLDRALASGSVQLQVQRNGASVSVAVTPVTVCDYAIGKDVLAGPPKADDGGWVMLDPQLLAQAADNDTDRQIAIAHTLAHLLDAADPHRTNVERAGKVADTVGALVGFRAHGLFSIATKGMEYGGQEERADALSLQLLAPVGVTPAQVLAFWERYANAHGDDSAAGRLMAAHPINADRLSKLRAAAQQGVASQASVP